MQQEVVLAMLAKEPSHGYELRTRLAQALGPVAEGINEAQMYVTLSRLEKGGFVERIDAPTQRSDRKVYCLTPAGQERVSEWNSARSGRGQLTSDIHSDTRSWPAGVRQ